MRLVRHCCRLSFVFLITLLAWHGIWSASIAQAGDTGPTEWSSPVNFSESPDMVSTNPVLICDPGQNTHALWTENDGQQMSVYYRTDRTGAWSAKNDILSAQSITFLDAAITPDGTLHLVWVNGTDLMYTSAPLQYADDARQWQPSRLLIGGLGATTGVMSGAGTIRSDQHGRLNVIIARKDDVIAQSHTLYYLQSDDNGNSWSDPVPVATLVAPEPSYVLGGLALDQIGRIHVAWDLRSMEYASFSQLGYLRSVDGGLSWSEPVSLATGSRPFGVAMPAAFAFGENEIHLTWDVPDRLHKFSSDGGNTWSASAPIMDLGAAFGGYNKLAKDSAGILHVISAVGEGVFHATWNGSGWNPKEAVDTRSFDPHGQQFVICQGNRLHVAYYDRTGENEIWYLIKTTNAPELARAAITTSEAAPTAIPLVVTEPSVTPTRSTATPLPNSSQDGLRNSSPTSSGVLPMIIGVAPAGLLVIGVVIANMARRRH